MSITEDFLFEPSRNLVSTFCTGKDRVPAGINAAFTANSGNKTISTNVHYRLLFLASTGSDQHSTDSYLQLSFRRLYTPGLAGSGTAMHFARNTYDTYNYITI